MNWQHYESHPRTDTFGLDRFRRMIDRFSCDVCPTFMDNLMRRIPEQPTGEQIFQAILYIEAWNKHNRMSVNSTVTDVSELGKLISFENTLSTLMPVKYIMNILNPVFDSSNALSGSHSSFGNALISDIQSFDVDMDDIDLILEEDDDMNIGPSVSCEFETSVETEKIECEQCKIENRPNFVFKTKSSLRRHMRSNIHNISVNDKGHNKYKCRIVKCKFSGDRSDNAKRHWETKHKSHISFKDCFKL